MKILLIADTDPSETDSAAARVAARAAHWTAWGHRVTMIAPRADSSAGSFGFMVSACLTGAAQSRPDVVVVASPRVSAGLAGWLLGRRHLRPLVLDPGDSAPAAPAAEGTGRRGHRQSLVAGLTRFLCRRAAAIAVPAASCQAALAARGVPPGRIAVIRAEDPAAASTQDRRRPAEEMLQLFEIVAAGYGDRAALAVEAVTP